MLEKLRPRLCRRRGGRAAVLCLVTTVLAAGCGADSSGGTGRRIVDSEAGLSYELPRGWDEKPKADLLEFFTSASGIETDSDGNGAILSLGTMEGLFAEEAPDLATMAEGLAIDFAEFFVPFEGERDKTADEAVEVGGRDAHRVALEITPEEAPAAVVEAIVVDLDKGPAFALGIVTPRDGGLERQVSEALESLDAAA
jgi:hypothetical protein